MGDSAEASVPANEDVAFGSASEPLAGAGAAPACTSSGTIGASPYLIIDSSFS